MQLADGGTLIVALRSNPSTGYSWAISENSTEHLELQGEPVFVPPGSTVPVPGAGGTEIFTFEAVESGAASLILEYREIMEPDPSPLETFEVAVEIR